MRQSTARAETDRFADARKVADTILYEGYVLYPYRASAIKNRYRWQFGVVAPREYAEKSGTDPWFMQSELLVEVAGDAVLDLELRYLQVEERQVEGEVADKLAGNLEPVDSIAVDGETHTTWQEGAPRTVMVPPIPVRDLLLDAPARFPFAAHAGVSHQDLAENGQRRGRVTRERWAIQGALVLSARPLGRYVGVRLRVENETRWRASASAGRAQAMRRACVGTHVLVGVTGGRFLSLADPPPDATEIARACRHEHCWPVLMGEPGSGETMLVSPIILDDHPRLAPESPGDLYDSTEIDEILTLRVMTLTDEEKAQARTTDERARRVIEHADAIPDEVFARLHGAIRSLRPIAPESPAAAGGAAQRAAIGSLDSWRDLLEETTPAEEAEIRVGSRRVARGSSVRLHPKRRADAMDMFLAGQLATVQAVHRDVDDVTYVAVTVDNDPGRDLHDRYGRFYYFYPEEIEPVDDQAGTESAPESEG